MLDDNNDVIRGGNGGLLGLDHTAHNHSLLCRLVTAEPKQTRHTATNGRQERSCNAREESGLGCFLSDLIGVTLCHIDLRLRQEGLLGRVGQTNQIRGHRRVHEAARRLHAHQGE